VTVRRAVVVGLALAVLCAAGVVAAQSPSDRGGDRGRGAQLFRTRGCLECHAKDLTDLQRRPRSPYALVASMWNRVPLMADRIRVAKARDALRLVGRDARRRGVPLVGRSVARSRGRCRTR
jgi:hypothetical protein